MWQKVLVKYWHFVTKNYLESNYSYVFCVLFMFCVLTSLSTHCLDHITTGGFMGRRNQCIQLVKVLHCKLQTNGKQLSDFILEVVLGTELRSQRWEARVLPLLYRGPYNYSISSRSNNQPQCFFCVCLCICMIQEVHICLVSPTSFLRNLPKRARKHCIRVLVNVLLWTLIIHQGLQLKLRCILPRSNLGYFKGQVWATVE